MSDGDGPSLNQLYGEAANQKVMGVRKVCRDRIVGQSEHTTKAYLQRTSNEALQLCSLIRARGGFEGMCEDLEHVAEVHEYFSGQQDLLHGFISDVYHKEHAPPDGTGEHTCPYEDDPSKRQCWSCHLPRIVYEQMESFHEEEVEDDD